MDKTKGAKKSIQVSIKLVMAISVFLIVVAWLFAGYVSRKEVDNVIVMGDNWTVSLQGKIHQNVVLKDFKFSGLQKGDSVDLYYTLDDRFDGTMMVEYLTYLSSVEAWVGDEKVYSEGVSERLSGKFVGSGYHRIPLTDNCAGQVLHIQVVVNSYNAITNITDVISAPGGVLFRTFCRKNFLSILSDSFLVILGVIAIIVGIPASIYSKHYFRLLFVGMFSFLVGLYSMCTNKLFGIFTYNTCIPTLLEYVALYLSPIPVGLSVWDMRRENNKRNAAVILGCALVVLLFDIGVTVLHIINVVSVPETLTAFHVLAVLIFTCFVYFGLIAVKNKTRADKVTTLGSFILAMAIVFDLARFNIQKYMVPGASVLLNSFLPVGTLIFVCFLIVSYIFHMYDMVLSNAEKQVLVSLAYNDQLTGLLNRAKYNEVIDELDSDKRDFALVNMDLNGLKQINDQYGHLIGDNLLKEFAAVLNEAFGNLGRCFRVGGDEFLVILEGNKINECDAAIAKLVEAEEIHSKKLDLQISCAYGVATRAECTFGSVGEVYKLSDKRMYAMKEKMKAE